MRDLIVVTVPAAREVLTVAAAVRETLTVDTGARGPRGFPGADGSGGGGGGTSNTFIQNTDPALLTPYVWFQTSAGQVIDIKVGGI